MRSLVIGLLALAAGAFAAPQAGVGSSARGDGGSDEGSDPRSHAGAAAGARKGRSAGAGAVRRSATPRTDGGPEAIDAGDPAGTLRGGPALRDVGGPSGAPGVAGRAPSTAELQQQIAALRARTAELEQRQGAAQDQLQLLAQMNAQLQALNQQMASAQAQRAESEAQRLDAAEQAAGRLELQQQAIGGLAAALDQLAAGSADVGGALDAADQSFPPQARGELAAARSAVASRNLGEARAHVQAAIAAAQAGR